MNDKPNGMGGDNLRRATGSGNLECQHTIIISWTEGSGNGSSF